jgi:hypothetical protein
MVVVVVEGVQVVVRFADDEGGLFVGVARAFKASLESAATRPLNNQSSAAKDGVVLAPASASLSVLAIVSLRGW